jgi:signal transduction histidine kinase
LPLLTHFTSSAESVYATDSLRSEVKLCAYRNLFCRTSKKILKEWESFASTILPGKQFDRATLRNDAAEILKTIAEDMETPQTSVQQTVKSKGRGPKTAQDTSAERHSNVRLGQGFNQVQALCEFRALRATVIRLWMNSSPELDDSAIYQLIRFNEGIDQALSESAARFMEQIEESRDFAVAVLAHDLRNPLNAILSSAQFLQITESIERATGHEAITNIIDSGSQMGKLIGNLLDFTRTRLGQSLPVKQEEIDLALVCRRTVAELTAAHPERTIDLSCPISSRRVDATRINQMLSNLIGNAIQHGAQSTPIKLAVNTESEHIVFRVHNEGAPIPESTLQKIFDLRPPRRKEDRKPENKFSHLGIGLFIVKKIVEAHSGTIRVTSSEKFGTTFIVSLPLSQANPVN